MTTLDELLDDAARAVGTAAAPMSVDDALATVLLTSARRRRRIRAITGAAAAVAVLVAATAIVFAAGNTDPFVEVSAPPGPGDAPATSVVGPTSTTKPAPPTTVPPATAMPVETTVPSTIVPTTIVPTTPSTPMTAVAVQPGVVARDVPPGPHPQPLSGERCRPDLPARWAANEPARYTYRIMYFGGPMQAQGGPIDISVDRVRQVTTARDANTGADVSEDLVVVNSLPLAQIHAWGYQQPQVECIEATGTPVDGLLAVLEWDQFGTHARMEISGFWLG